MRDSVNVPVAFSFQCIPQLFKSYRFASLVNRIPLVVFKRPEDRWIGSFFAMFFGDATTCGFKFSLRGSCGIRVLVRWNGKQWWSKYVQPHMIEKHYSWDCCGDGPCLVRCFLQVFVSREPCKMYIMLTLAFRTTCLPLIESNSRINCNSMLCNVRS